MTQNVQSISIAGVPRTNQLIAGGAIAMFAVLGAAMVIWATNWGAGITLDSTRYLSAANDLGTSLSGDSAHRLVHYPPLFPVALSLGRLFGARPLDWSRWMHAGLMLLNILLAGRLLMRIVDRRSTLWIAILGAALLAVCRDSIKAHSSIWSEPLYITFLLGSLLWLHRYLISDEHAIREVIFAAVCVALACLTRYAGASLIAAGVVSIIVLNPTSRKWIHAFIFAGISAALPTLWSVYNHLTVGRATGRSIGFHPPTLFHYRGLFNTFLDWWIPRTAPQWLQMIVVILATAVLFISIALLIRRPAEAESTSAPDRSATTLLKMLLIFAVLYPAFLFVSISTADIRTPLDDRILLPEFAVGLMINLILLKWFWQWAKPWMALRAVTVLFCISLVSIYATSSVLWASSASDTGLGWARKRYVDPDLVKLLKTIPSTAMIYTNEPSPLLAENFTGVIDPIPTFSGDPKKDMDFRLEMRELRTQIEDGQAWIIFFSHSAKASEIEHAELRQMLPLSVRGRGDKWVVYARNRRRVAEMNAAQRAARRPSTTSTSQPLDESDDADEPVTESP